MSTSNIEHAKAVKAMEELLISLDQQNLWEVYDMQGFLGFTFELKNKPPEVYRAVWQFIKKNKCELRFYQSIPEDI